MWTIVKFALHSEADYGAAFELLAPAGFRLHRRPEFGDPEPFPAEVVADTFQDPAVIARAVFEGLHGAGLDPVGVAACHGVAARPARSARALAQA